MLANRLYGIERYIQTLYSMNGRLEITGDEIDNVLFVAEPMTGCRIGLVLKIIPSKNYEDRLEGDICVGIALDPVREKKADSSVTSS